MADDDAADAPEAPEANNAKSVDHWRIPRALRAPLYDTVMNEVAKSTKGKLSARPGSVTTHTGGVPHALFQRSNAFRLTPEDPITLAEVKYPGDQAVRGAVAECTIRW